MGESPVALRKELTLVHGVSVIVGIVIGAGIFVSPVGIMYYVESVGASLVVWLLMGALTTVCALCYAELGTTILSSGGEYIYIYTAFGSLPAFLCLWTGYLLIAGVANAALALLFAEYITQPMFMGCTAPAVAKALIAALVTFLLTAINCFNTKWAAKVQIVFLATKLGALGLIIILGCVHMAKGNTEYIEDSFEGSNWNAGAVVMALYSAFWSYGGWWYLNMLVGELKNPKRDLPLSIIISLVIITSVYILANISYAAVLSPAELISSPAVAVTFAERTMGRFKYIMPVFVALSIFGGMNGGLLSVSRFVQMGAEKGHFPQVLAMLSINHVTPVPALISMCVLIMCLLVSNDVFFLIELLGFGYSLIMAAVMAALLYLRYSQPNLPRTLKLPLIIPILAMLFNVMIIVITIYSQPLTSGRALLLIVIGVPLYIIGVAWKNKPLSFLSRFDKVTKFLQKIFLIIPQEATEEEEEQSKKQ